MGWAGLGWAGLGGEGRGGEGRGEGEGEGRGGEGRGGRGGEGKGRGGEGRGGEGREDPCWNPHCEGGSRVREGFARQGRQGRAAGCRFDLGEFCDWKQYCSNMAMFESIWSSSVWPLAAPTTLFSLKSLDSSVGPSFPPCWGIIIQLAKRGERNVGQRT